MKSEIFLRDLTCDICKIKKKELPIPESIGVGIRYDHLRKLIAFNCIYCKKHVVRKD